MLDGEIMFVQVIEIERCSEEVIGNGEDASCSNCGCEIRTDAHAAAEAVDEDGYCEAFAGVREETVVGEGV
jgi:hypothetical protein